MADARAPGQVLVTGATGLVGEAVTRALLGAGHEVVALVRSPAGAAPLAAAGARLRTGDITDPETLRSAVPAGGAVVNAAQLRVRRAGARAPRPLEAGHPVCPAAPGQAGL